MPLVYRLLGTIYLTVGLDHEATQSYGQAYDLAKAQRNRLVQAEAAVGLGHIAYTSKDYETALDRYQEALALYQELESESDVEIVERLVAGAGALIPTPTQ